MAVCIDRKTKVSELTNNRLGIRCAVVYCPALDEYQVKYSILINGTYNRVYECDYFTNDLSEANQTAQRMAQLV